MKEYTIRELSEMFGLPASTIRYYEDEGILTNVGRTTGSAFSRTAMSTASGLSAVLKTQG